MPLLKFGNHRRLFVIIWSGLVFSRNRYCKLLRFPRFFTLCNLIKAFYDLILKRRVNRAVLSDHLLVICTETNVRACYFRHGNLCPVSQNLRRLDTVHQSFHFRAVIRNLSFINLELIDRYVIPACFIFQTVRRMRCNIQTHILCLYRSVQRNLLYRFRWFCCKAGRRCPVRSII